MNASALVAVALGHSRERRVPLLSMLWAKHPQNIGNALATTPDFIAINHDFSIVTILQSSLRFWTRILPSDR